MVRDTLSCFLGVHRLFGWLSGARGGTPLEQRVRAITARSWHWWSLDREAFQAAALDRETIAAGAVPRIPLLIFANAAREEEAWRPAYLALLSELARTSARGEMRSLPGPVPHELLLQSPASLTSLSEALRALASE
jgi:hypothetical protein